MELLQVQRQALLRHRHQAPGQVRCSTEQLAAVGVEIDSTWHAKQASSIIQTPHARLGTHAEPVSVMEFDASGSMLAWLVSKGMCLHAALGNAAKRHQR
jgi:hypothetical protein